MSSRELTMRFSRDNLVELAKGGYVQILDFASEDDKGKEPYVANYLTVRLTKAAQDSLKEWLEEWEPIVNGQMGGGKIPKAKSR